MMALVRNTPRVQGSVLQRGFASQGAVCCLLRPAWQGVKLS